MWFWFWAPQSKILATPMDKAEGGGILGCALQVTACVFQARVNFSTRTRGPAKLLPKNRSPQMRFYETASQIEETWSSSQRFYDENTFLVFLKFEGKIYTKEDNIEFGAKYSPHCCRISNASRLGCVSVPPKVFVFRETHYSGTGSVTILF